MPACPGWPRLTIWKPKGSKSLYIMHDLRGPQSIRPAPDNEWTDTCLSRKGRFGTLRFGHAIYREYLASEHSLSYIELFPTCVYCPGLTKNSLFLILNFCTLKEQWLLCACHFLSEPLCGIYYVKYVGLSQRKILRICLELVISFGIFSWGFYKTIAHGALKFYSECFSVLHHDRNLHILLRGCIYTTEISQFPGEFSNSSKIRLMVLQDN